MNSIEKLLSTQSFSPVLFSARLFEMKLNLEIYTSWGGQHTVGHLGGGGWYGW